jgi:hypothetical protein
LLAEVSDLVGQWLPVQAGQATAPDLPAQLQELATRLLKLVLLQTTPHVPRQHPAIAAVLEAAQNALQLRSTSPPASGPATAPPEPPSSEADRAAGCLEKMQDSLEGLAGVSGIKPALSRQARAMAAEAALLMGKAESGDARPPAGMGFTWVESTLLTAMKEGHWVSSRHTHVARDRPRGLSMGEVHGSRSGHHRVRAGHACLLLCRTCGVSVVLLHPTAFLQVLNESILHNI